MSGRSPDILMDPVTGDLPDYAAHAAGMAITAQRVRVRLTTLLGDWPLDRKAGVDWVRIFGTKPLDAEEVSALLVLEIIDTPGVSAVQDVEVTTLGDALTFTAVVLTEAAERLQVVVEPFGIDGNPSVVVGLLGASGGIVYA